MRNSESQATASQGSNTVCLAEPKPSGEVHLPAGAIPSGSLFQNRREVTISHQGSLYRLRITRQGKLILHK
ncbi:hemin uptake protein hemP [Hoeflea halophila]|uniref:Hemin uptake protein hemP n=1 Tax=Hoeflea halophila TaxID=714899 RepID=A0A286IEG1_9HYPH|nr:hemin uptake protein HemP [Hoeflea halophila]SOE18417.1 hemin uptake protein hemP [Hoeflea halophila]